MGVAARARLAAGPHRTPPELPMPPPPPLCRPEAVCTAGGGGHPRGKVASPAHVDAPAEGDLYPSDHRSLGLGSWDIELKKNEIQEEGSGLARGGPRFR